MEIWVNLFNLKPPCQPHIVASQTNAWTIPDVYLYSVEQCGHTKYYSHSIRKSFRCFGRFGFNTRSSVVCTATNFVISISPTRISAFPIVLLCICLRACGGPYLQSNASNMNYLWESKWIINLKILRRWPVPAFIALLYRLPYTKRTHSGTTTHTHTQRLLWQLYPHCSVFCVWLSSR